MKILQKLALRYIRTKFRLLATISKKRAAEKAFNLFCTPQFRNKKALPRIFETAEKIRFRFQSFNITGYRWNKGGQRRVLILHGFESSVINFDAYIKPLVQKGYEVLAFDAPAHGRSSGRRINAVVYSNFIIHIYKNYGPVQSFMAHSLGGLALCLALEKLTHDKNTRMVLIAPATETSTAIKNFFFFLQLDAAIEPEFEKIIIETGGKPSSWYSVRRAIKNIKANVLWFHDEDDAQTPLIDALGVKADNHPNIEFVFTKGLGHRRIYRDNQVRKRIIEFL